MADNARLFSAMGLCAKAGKMTVGEDACERAPRARKVRLLLLEQSASDNTRKKFGNLCGYYHVPCFLVPEGADHAIGKQGRKVIGILDARFAQMIQASTILTGLDGNTRGGEENGENQDL